MEQSWSGVINSNIKSELYESTRTANDRLCYETTQNNTKVNDMYIVWAILHIMDFIAALRFVFIWPMLIYIWLYSAYAKVNYADCIIVNACRQRTWLYFRKNCDLKKITYMVQSYFAGMRLNVLNWWRFVHQAITYWGLDETFCTRHLSVSIIFFKYCIPWYGRFFHSMQFSLLFVYEVPIENKFAVG